VRAATKRRERRLQILFHFFVGAAATEGSVVCWSWPVVRRRFAVTWCVGGCASCLSECASFKVWVNNDDVISLSTTETVIIPPRESFSKNESNQESQNKQAKDERRIERSNEASQRRPTAIDQSSIAADDGINKQKRTNFSLVAPPFHPIPLNPSFLCRRSVARRSIEAVESRDGKPSWAAT